MVSQNDDTNGRIIKIRNDIVCKHSGDLKGNSRAWIGGCRVWLILVLRIHISSPPAWAICTWAPHSRRQTSHNYPQMAVATSVTHGSWARQKERGNTACLTTLVTFSKLALPTTAVLIANCRGSRLETCIVGRDVASYDGHLKVVLIVNLAKWTMEDEVTNIHAVLSMSMNSYHFCKASDYQQNVLYPQTGDCSGP